MVRLNLPGMEDYDPRLSWCSKVRADGVLVADMFTYVGDQRSCAPTELDCWLSERRIGSINNYLGIQDEARKRREPDWSPGAWAGSVITTASGSVYVLVSQSKWEKGQAYVEELQAMLDSGEEYVSRGCLETIRGFLLYATRSYPTMTPYMKGLHLTIDGWRPDRDSEGWRIKPKGSQAVRAAGLGETVPRNGDLALVWKGPLIGFVEETLAAPEQVKLMPRLRADVEALRQFFGSPEPPKRFIRGSTVLEVFYGFGDASGSGFGVSFDGLEPNSVYYRFGQWCSAVSEESSNYRELRNLVDSLEAFIKEHDLKEVEIFLFTDNSVSESAYWKGNSSSRKLFELVLWLKKLELDHNLLLHVINVSGKRMCRQGTDGLSRADFSEGVMAGIAMTAFVPLHLLCVERCPGLEEWLLSLLDGCTDTQRGPVCLSPEGWFREAHTQGSFIWTPAPAVADVVVEQLGKARHKRPDCFHLVAVPRLMTGRWRKILGQECDFYFKIPAGCRLWPEENHEPLLVYVCLPFLAHRLWLCGKRRELDKLVGHLLEEGVWGDCEEWCRSLLLEFLSAARAFSGVEKLLVRRMKVTGSMKTMIFV